MTDPPTGTVTFVFTDVEGSTRLLAELGAAVYGELLAEHRRAIRESFGTHGGHEVDTQGDAFFYAFAVPADAVAAAAEAQARLAAGTMHVRVGIHTGHPTLTADGYVGLDVHRAARIAAAGHGGQVLLSASTRELLDDPPSLPDLLDLGDHRLKDLTHKEHIFQLGDAPFPPLRTLNRSNLPVAATELVGRGPELAALLALLRDGGRAVTVTGPGGTGKTRLALQVAAELVDEFPGGVFWVPLAGLTEPDLVIPSISQAMDAEGDIVEHIGTKKTLLLLDNFEQLLPAARAVAELLAAAPGLKVLVTSRAPLRIEAERQYQLDPFTDDDAVAFFLDRAAAAGQDLAPAEQGLAPDPRIPLLCRRLDRLPLALELAASRVRVLGLAGLVSRLDRALPLLTTGPRDAPERQRTLRAAIAWSYDLLGGAARSLFPRLAVFSGSFSLEAAEGVCSAGLDELDEIVAASLVKQSGEGRFTMLATIREFGLERLEESGGAAAQRRSHVSWFLRSAEASETELAGPEQDSWSKRMALEQNDLREAMGWALAAGEREIFLRFVAALWLQWYRHGESLEAERWYGAALALPGVPDPGLMARVRYGAAQVPMMRAKWPESILELEQAGALAEEAGETRTLIRALGDLGTAYHYAGDREASHRSFERALGLARDAGDRQRAAMIVGNAGEAALEEGDHERAEELVQASLAEYRLVGDALGAASTLDTLGKLALDRGDLDGASRSLYEAISMVRPLGAAAHVASLLSSAGSIALARDDPFRAARMFGAADAIAERLQITLYEAIEHDRRRERARELLGDHDFALAHRAGAELDADAALTEASVTLENADAPTASSRDRSTQGEAGGAT